VGGDGAAAGSSGICRLQREIKPESIGVLQRMINSSALNIDDFSLAKGGLFYRLLVRTRLMRDDLAPAMRRAVFLSLFAWLPLLVLSAIEGAAFGHAVKIPFLYDFPVSVRLLLALPLLIVAEGVIDVRSMDAVRHFVRSGLVEEKNFPEFRSTVRQTLRMRDSFLAEGIIVALVIFSTAFLRPGDATCSDRSLDDDRPHGCPHGRSVSAPGLNGSPA
jgi:hypothetical protein